MLGEIFMLITNLRRRSRFLITAKDKETALAACRQVLKNNGRI